jgi:RNA polymerase sigma-70 factor (ECF subfamily)
MDRLGENITLDDKTFGQLVNKYKERIYSVVLRIVRNKEEAKDLAQEAFVKAYKSRASFRAESAFYTWVYRIAVNLALNYVNRNRERRAESIENAIPAALTEPATDKIEQAELGEAIAAAIEKLPARQRTVFVLRHYEEKAHAEIAKILSITEGAVKANYFQAVQKLKAALSGYLTEGKRVS